MFKGKDIEVNTSLFWLVVAVTSLGLLAWLVPAAFYLIAFLGVVVTTHEAGHFFVAKKAGMKPTEFYWGFGPEIISFSKDGCRYGLKVLSLGGYVRLEGMTSDSELPEGFAEEDTFRAATPTGRLLTILGGPFVNFGVAIAAFTAAELMAGASLVQSVKQGFYSTYFMIAETIRMFSTLFTNLGSYADSIFGDVNEAPTRAMSVVAQAEASEAFLQQGPVGIFFWLGILSAAIGIVNLLPLPPLDGAHALAAIVDGITRRFTKKPEYAFNMKRLVPLAYANIAFLILFSISALIMDLRVMNEAALSVLP